MSGKESFAARASGEERRKFRSRKSVEPSDLNLLASLERGAVRKDPGGRLSVALIWPGEYHTGQSSLGFLWVYRFLAQSRLGLAERFFSSDPVSGRPLSLESRRPLDSFDLLAASLVLENDYWLLLNLLTRAGLSPERSERRGQGPMLLVGGVGVWSNPWPVLPFVDLVLAGEGEEQWPPLLDLFTDKSFAALDYYGRLRALSAAVPGLLAPALWPEEALSGRGAPNLAETLSRSPRLRGRREDAASPPCANDSDSLKPVVPALLKWPFPQDLLPPATSILTPKTEFPLTTLVEISRGCPWGCRFCLAGYLYRPHRPWSGEAVLKAAFSQVPEGGRVGLVSPAVAEHPELGRIIDGLIERGASVGFSSLRLSALTESLAAKMSKAGLKGLAVAPEAGSQKLRDVINKNLNESEILSSAALLSSYGLRRLKLYFMIGLPGETLDDLAAMAALTEKIQKAVRGAGRGPVVAVSVANFTPKPHTAFESAPLATMEEMRKKGQLVAGLLSKIGGLEVRLDPPRWTLIQGLLARGGPESANLVRALNESGGRAGEALKIFRYAPTHHLHEPQVGVKPWRVVAPPVGFECLEEEEARSRSARITPACPTEGHCGRCRACQAALSGDRRN
ncbi:MAG: radical SAM protein [Deltaproteobacteria bacterium]|nr:radical SAM protein [Deltaproteobacteria bacterium]